MYYMSFADGELPKGSQFLGACFVESDSPVEAHFLACAYSLNPGGEILYIRVPVDMEYKFKPYLNRLLSRQELEEIDGPCVVGSAKELLERVNS